jgi:putative salt-induced outer membrane protein
MLRGTLLTVLLLSPLVLADQVTLKNGDRLSGTIVKYDGKNLVIKAEFAGQVTIPWDSVTGITSTDPLNVGLKGGQMLLGPLTTAADGKIQVATQGAGTVSVTRDSIEVIRSKDEQAAYQAEIDHYRNPRLVDLWTGTLDLGYSESHGNANTQTFTLNTNADRATMRDKIAVYYTSIFSTSDASGKSLTTANAKRGGIAYNLNVRPRLFVFGSVDLESDQFQDLDLRFSPAGGLGYHIIKNDKTSLDGMFGVAANREFFSTGLNRTSAEILLGEELTHKFTSSTSVHEKLVFYPNASDGGTYRMNFDTSAVTILRKWLSWQLSVSDRYLSNPVAGRKKNDVLFTTGLRLTFAK